MNLTKYLFPNFNVPKMWVVFLLTWGLIVGTRSEAMTSQLQMEADVIQNNGWWYTYGGGFNISNRCNWPAISCNKVGSIKAINISFSSNWQIQFSGLNISVFHNLESLVIESIGLQGTIPEEIGLLSKLTHLDLSCNSLKGEIPYSLGNLSKLTHLDLSNNFFGGDIPPSFGNLTQLKKLYICNNIIKGEIPPSLGNLKQLEFLDISCNNIQGFIPHELGFLKNLTRLDLSNNRIKGDIPASLGNLKLLEYLHISYNKIQGSIPHELGFLKQLYYLDISYNNIQGAIPHELGFLKNLTTLDLSHNRLNRSMPILLTNLTQLRYLDISNNFLTGGIPSNFDQLESLGELRLNNNSIGGTFPISLTNLSQLENLDISYNLLLGTLPSKMFPSAYDKTSIDLSHNFITGEIPSELGYFYILNLSSNNLTGMVPQSLCNFSSLDISYNCFIGPIPSCLSYTIIPSKEGYCLGSQISYKKSNNHKVKKDAVIVLSILMILILPLSLIMCFKLCHNNMKNNQANKTTKKNGDFFCIWNYDGQIVYDDIIRATEDFDIRYCIGTGAYGSVYKAQLPCGKVVALKKLHGYEAEVPSFDESFRNEVRILSEIKHKHIVKLYGFCLHKRIMFLIYQYMEKGSLFYVLYDEVEAVEFNWRKRVNIVKGVAFGLSYLHHDCSPRVVHRDVSTSNILLNSEWQPSVSDFGTARLLQYDSSNRTIVAGTIGYIAPGNSFF